MNIYRKIFLSFIVVSLLVLVMGFLSIITFEQVLKESIGTESITAAGQLSEEISRLVHSRIEAWLLFSKNPGLRESVTHSNLEFASWEDPQSVINDRDDEWVNQENTELKNTLLANDPSKELQNRISFFVKRYGIPVVAEVFVTNSFGAVIGLSQETSDYRQDDESWWIIAKNEGLYVEDVAFDESANVHTIDVSIRIDDNNSNFIGVMKVSFSLQELERLVNSSNELYSHERDKVFVVSEEGIILFSSVPSEFLQDISDTEFFHLLKEQQGFIRTTNTDGESIIQSYVKTKRFRDFDGFDWIVVVEHREADILEPFEHVKKRIIFLSFIITFLALVMGFLISKSLTSPIKKLTAVINDISVGNLERQIDPKLKDSRDEIGGLARSFERILTSLKLAMQNTSTKFSEQNQEEISGKDTAKKNLEKKQ